MKKFLLIFCLIFVLSLSLPNQQYAFADNAIYAKIENDDVFMFSAPQNNEKNKLFCLPSSYFVKLIDEADENFYYCYYKDQKGYVKKSDVSPMKGIPSKPYLEGLFRTFSLEGLGLYSSPHVEQNNLLATIPYLTDDLIFYGSLLGQEVIPDKTKEWYYCKYNSANGICGYVYSVFCDKVPSFVENTERFEKIEQPFSQNKSPKPLSSVAMGFIIIGVSIPCLVVIFLLLKPTLLKEKLNIKPKLKARRKRDYFEFDDSDLN